MVDAKICMATERRGHKGQVYDALRNRFPEIPEQVVSETLAQHGNLEICISILTAESDRYLYGSGNLTDSPVPIQPSSQNHHLEPISISIPPTTTTSYPSNTYVSPLQPLVRPMTVAQPSSGVSYVEGNQMDRQPSSLAAYSQAILQRQQQRLEKVRKEYEKSQLQLIRIRQDFQEKEEEMVNKKFRIARNPSATDVRHLRDENRVLREEIEQMTREIDGLSNGQDVVLRPPPSSRSRDLQTQPESSQPSRYPPAPVRKSASFPRSENSAGMNGPTSSLQRFCSMLGGFKPSSHGEESPTSLSPPHDTSLEREWIFLPPDTFSQNYQSTEERTWSCAHCTFANHEALDICEVCEMPRNRALEARA